MEHVVVVKSLMNNILLTRTESGSLLSLAMPCQDLNPGSVLCIDPDSADCPIHSVDGQPCAGSCERARKAVVIQHGERDEYVVPTLRTEAQKKAL